MIDDFFELGVGLLLVWMVTIYYIVLCYTELSEDGLLTNYLDGDIFKASLL